MKKRKLTQNILRKIIKEEVLKENIWDRNTKIIDAVLKAEGGTSTQEKFAFLRSFLASQMMSHPEIEEELQSRLKHADKIAKSTRDDKVPAEPIADRTKEWSPRLAAKIRKMGTISRGEYEELIPDYVSGSLVSKMWYGEDYDGPYPD